MNYIATSLGLNESRVEITSERHFTEQKYSLSIAGYQLLIELVLIVASIHPSGKTPGTVCTLLSLLQPLHI
jgi:hypothetical protein